MSMCGSVTGCPQSRGQWNRCICSCVCVCVCVCDLGVCACARETLGLWDQTQLGSIPPLALPLGFGFLFCESENRGILLPHSIVGRIKLIKRTSLVLSSKESACQAGDAGSIPDLGRSHMTQSNEAPFTTTTEAVLQSLGAATTEPKHCNYRNVRTLELVLHKGRSHCSEKPVQCNQRAALVSETRGKPTQQQRPSTAIN